MQNVGAAWLMIRSGLARRPTGASWLELWGVALLCGIGFSMSFYIGALAFPDALGLARSQVSLGVMIGSLASGLAAIAALGVAANRRDAIRAARP